MTSTPKKPDLLFVDDDDDFRDTLFQRFTRRGFRVQVASGGAQALDLVERVHFDVVILDMMMPGLSGIEVLERLKAADPESEVLLLTGEGTIETAVQAMRLGAYDFLTKPFSLADLESRIDKAYEHGQLCKENVHLKAALKRTAAAPQMIGASPAMQEVFRLIERAGKTDKSILIQGESGTGKELVAKALHQASLRADKPIITINCAALPETLLESELFGHEKGAFTGAVATKQGLFELADGGTLFIDEVGELAPSLQAKLLRVLEDGSMRRVGSLKERRVDVRLLAATNRDMQDEVAKKNFREDLYYRINVMSLMLPPLRQRQGDVPLLVRHALSAGWTVEPAAMRAIEAYSWPGNIRQLLNALERAQIMADDQCIRLCDLPPEVVGGTSDGPSATSLAIASGERLSDVQRAHVLEVLEREKGNKARAAKALGVNRRSLYRLLEKYGITPEGDGSDLS
jgi:DNA-binding NtrC family response regulator